MNRVPYRNSNGSLMGFSIHCEEEVQRVWIIKRDSRNIYIATFTRFLLLWKISGSSAHQQLFMEILKPWCQHQSIIEVNRKMVIWKRQIEQINLADDLKINFTQRVRLSSLISELNSDKLNPVLKQIVKWSLQNEKYSKLTW